MYVVKYVLKYVGTDYVDILLKYIVKYVHTYSGTLALLYLVCGYVCS